MNGRLRAGSWLAVASLCSAVATACATAPQVRETPAQLRVLATPSEARVYVEEQFVGPARLLASTPTKLRPGVRHVTIDAPGYFPHDVEVNLPSGVTTIRIALRPVPR